MSSIDSNKRDTKMSTIKISEGINHNRRRFFGAASMTLAAARLGIFGSKDAHASELNPAGATASKPGASTSFAPRRADQCLPPECWIRRSRTAAGPAVILLHGWPYDIYSFVDVAPILASKGYRVIVPVSAVLWQLPAFSPVWTTRATPSSRSLASTSSLSWTLLNIKKAIYRRF